MNENDAEELKKIILANLQLYHKIIASDEFHLTSQDLPGGGKVLIQNHSAVVEIPTVEIETQNIDFDTEW